MEAAAGGAVKFDVKEQQKEFIRRMKYQGVLDSYFDTLVLLRTAEDSSFIVEIIEDYEDDSTRLMATLEREIGHDISVEQLASPLDGELEVTIVEFRRCLSNHSDDLLNDPIMRDLHRLKGSSSCLGGGRVAAACHELKDLYYNDKPRCSESFKKLKTEYKLFIDALIEIKQMEMAILKEQHESPTIS